VLSDEEVVIGSRERATRESGWGFRWQEKAAAAVLGVLIGVV
jgi:hypothetical protein